MSFMATRFLCPKLLSTAANLSSCLHISSRMATRSQVKAENGDDISGRALKKKRGRAVYQKKHKITKPLPLDHENINETEYYFENGLRKVYPYYYNFSTYVKGRWYGRTILDVFTKEFKSETEEKYRETIENGRLTVNGKKVPTDFVLGDNQLLEHKCHRHENPVVAAPIQIVEDTPQVLVINKPSSIPCHPCGRYRYNSLTFILDKEYGYKNLRTLYRLDRLTSGVLIFPKTTETSRRLEKQLLQRQLQKEYICRVVGQFPDGEVECREPLGVLSHKLSIYGVVPGGKESHTTFTRISYNGTSSVVKCIPHTGRTHQIRLHLQYLGYPIVNDPLYNSTAFGPQKGKGGVVDRPLEQIEEHTMKTHNTGMWKTGDSPLYATRMALKEEQSVKTGSELTSTGIEETSNDESSTPPQKRARLEEESDEVMTESCSSSSCNLDAANIEVSSHTDNTQISDESAIELNATETVVIANQSVEGLSSKDSINMASSESNLSNSNEITDHTDSQLKEVNASNTGAETSNTDCTDDSRLTQPGGDDGESKVTDWASSNSIGDGLPNTDVTDRDDGESKVADGASSIGDAVTSMDVTDKDDGVAEVTDGASSIGDVTTHVSLTSRVYQEDKDEIDEYCDGCKYLYQEPKAGDLVMFLHAVKYKGPGWEYSTPTPDWAAEDWQDDKAEN